jgi:hypothetical protein
VPGCDSSATSSTCHHDGAPAGSVRRSMTRLPSISAMVYCSPSKATGSPGRSGTVQPVTPAACAAPTHPTAAWCCAEHRVRSAVSRPAHSRASSGPGLMPRPASRQPQVRVRELLTVPRQLPGPRDLRLGHDARTAVTGQEPDVLQHRRIRARPHLVLPAVPPGQHARPGQRLSHLRVLQPLRRLNVHQPGRPRIRHEKEIGHMMPDPAADAGREPARLGIDLLHLRVEVSQQQPGQFQAALVDHEPARRPRRVRPRGMRLPVP